MSEYCESEIMNLLRIAMETEKSLLHPHNGAQDNAAELRETRQQIYKLLAELRRN